VEYTWVLLTLPEAKLPDQEYIPELVVGAFVKSCGSHPVFGGPIGSPRVGQSNRVSALSWAHLFSRMIIFLTVTPQFSYFYFECKRINFLNFEF
jgi:hypothetical protein